MRAETRQWITPGAGGSLRNRFVAVGAATLLSLLAGCTTPPTPGGDAFRPPAGALADRTWQSRRFAGMTRPAMLSACAAVLQDLGFTLEETESTIGLIVASKDRSARKQQTKTQAFVQESAILAVSVAVSVLLQQPIYVGENDPAERQVIRAVLLVQPGEADARAGNLVRVSFQRVVHNQSGRIRSVETAAEPALIQGFFEALSKSTFLELQQL